jgi:hypothetical protein
MAKSRILDGLASNVVYWNKADVRSSNGYYRLLRNRRSNRLGQRHTCFAEASYHA